MRPRAAVLGAFAGLALAGVLRAQPAAGPDATLLRDHVAPSVCVVTAENAWGVPVGMATGFLLGDGRFAVTDLGVVAQRGVVKATLRFQDGSTVTATQFGLADPALGLAALRLETDALSRAGLPLALTMPALDGLEAVAAVGWRYGKDLDLVTGRVWRGPTIESVAARSGVRTPPGVDSFLRMDGGRIDAASGAPVIDMGGTVLAVRLDVAARNIQVALAMPAATLRQSLLGAEPALKPLSALPEPLWPVYPLRLAGDPPTPDKFAAMRNTIRASTVCTTCEGKGKVREEARGLLGRLRGDDAECPACRGEGIAVEPGVYEVLAAWAEQGTRVVWAPGPGGQSRVTVRTAGQEMTRWLAGSGRHFRDRLATLAGQDLGRLAYPAPRGVVMIAQVHDTVGGPDGPYVILNPLHVAVQVAVRVSDLVGSDGRGPAGLGHKPADKSWVVLAGTVLSSFQSGQYSGVYVLPFEWTQAPPPGPLPPAGR